MSHSLRSFALIKKIWYNTPQMNKMYERNLPEYLANDLAAWKKGVFGV